MPPAVRAPSPTVTLEPDWANWSAALAKKQESPARAQLGIPSDRPVLFSGHQPVVFHNGILAKLIAQHEAAARTGASRVWIVADQDPAELETLRAPSGRGESLGQASVRLLPQGATPPGVPSASLPALDPLDPEDQRFEELVSYLRGYTHETSLGRQFASATIQLACDRLGIDPPHMIFASTLLGSDPMWEIGRQRLGREAYEAVLAYNNAVEKHPDARVRALAIEGDRIELPLWGLREGASRVAIDTGNIDRFSREQLAPRGLLMSLLVRARLGELFIHGAGGWRYDQITQDWARGWLGLELAPMALATATQHLDLGFDEDQAASPHQASWRLHHARHTPGMLGDERNQMRKDELVAAIADRKARGEHTDALYQELVVLLEAHRDRHAQQLGALRRQVEHARANRRQLELANDRTWPFVLFDESALRRLRDEVVARMR